MTANVSWDLRVLARPPAVYPAPGFRRPKMRALFFQGLPWKGRPTRVFAYMGIPKHKAGEKVPGLVVAHGGSGTAFADWVKLWMDRGYAVIAPDLSGGVPDRMKTGYAKTSVPHKHGGPKGYGSFDHIDDPAKDQWVYHGVGALILAHSLLRAQPGVDGIGITGVSWGGFLTCIAAGMDARFRFAAPVYGCGFLTKDSFISPELAKLGRRRAKKWESLWEPSRYLGHARQPFLWINGTNDLFPLDALRKSCRLVPGPCTLCLPVRMPHGHGGPSETPEEIHAFANSILKGGPPLARITGRTREGSRVAVAFVSPSPLVRAELNYTKDSGKWSGRHWKTKPAVLDRGQARALLPDGATAYYFHLTDARGLTVSSEPAAGRL